MHTHTLERVDLSEFLPLMVTSYNKIHVLKITMSFIGHRDGPRPLVSLSMWLSFSSLIKFHASALTVQ